MPTWLSRSLYCNSPRLTPKEPQPHWFNGLAYLQGFHFSHSKVVYNTRFVGSTQYNKSKATFTHTSMDPCKALLSNTQTNYVLEAQSQFSSLVMSGKTFVNNKAPLGHAYSYNTAVTINKVATNMYLANMAAMTSNQFNPATLGDLVTPFLFHNNLEDLSSLEHQHVDPHSNLFHFAYIFGPCPGYMLYWIPLGTLNWKVLANASVNLLVGQPSYLHSFCLTENFIVLLDIPVPLMLWSQFRLVPGVPTTWRAFDCATGKEMFNWTSSPFFTFHHINCYKNQETKAIVLDLITFPDITVIADLFLDVLLYNLAKAMSSLWHGRPYWYKLPMNRPYTMVTGSKITPDAVELPTINYNLYNTRPYHYFYAISASSPHVNFYDQLVKVDTQLHTTKVWRQPNTYPGEPIFMPAPNSRTEDDGVILSVVLDPATNRSFLVTLNATTFTEIARAHTPHYAPFGFHGMYSEGVL